MLKLHLLVQLAEVASAGSAFSSCICWFSLLKLHLLVQIAQITSAGSAGSDCSNYICWFRLLKLHLLDLLVQIAQIASAGSDCSSCICWICWFRLLKCICWIWWFRLLKLHLLDPPPSQLDQPSQPGLPLAHPLSWFSSLSWISPPSHLVSQQAPSHLVSLFSSLSCIGSLSGFCLPLLCRASKNRKRRSLRGSNSRP